MAFQTSFSDSALSADVVRDANPTIQFTKIKSFERYGLLRLLACLVPLTGLILLTGLMPVDPKPGDLMPVDPIQAINRYVVKTHKSWIRKDGRPMLPVSESLSQEDKESYTLYLSGNSGLTRAAIEECESLLQLFVLMEKCALKNPGDYEIFTELMQLFAKNIVTIKKLENYEEWRLFYERTTVLSLILIVVSLFVLMELYHFDLKSWCSKEGRMMLRISEILSQDAKEWFTLYLSSGDSQLPPVAAIEELKLLLQLFVLMEKCALICPGELEFFINIMPSIENIANVKEIENYRAIERSSVHHIQQSSSPRFQHHQGGRVAYNTGNQSNMRRNSAPTFKGYTQNPSWGGQGYQGKPPSQQQPYHNYPPQQSHQPQQQATPSYSQQNPQQWQHGQQPAIKTEPEDRTSSASSGLPKRPKWYYEAFQKNGAAYKTKPGDDEREAWVTRDLRLGLIEDTAGSSESEQSSTLINEGHRIVPAQTATLIPHPNTDGGHMLDLPKYKMDRLPRGLCIIFNGENFASKYLDKRLGTQKDVEGLLDTFQNNLKFQTYVQNDPTAQEYIDYLQEIGRKDHSKFDCFVCIILSHGCKGRVYGKNGGVAYIDALTGLFRGEYVPSLVNKPKLFFIQACQGNEAQEAVDIQQDATATLPNESDTLVSLSTVPGYASNRSVSQGTWFISSLCMIINSYYKKKVDLLSMLTLVNEQLSKAADKEKGKQIGNPSHTLRKQIFFNQGLNE